ncbi:hypothetical protein Rsub_03716 [Raphidocelis subcapitata]|uniref:Uncharacterized protein n=1 Tax=Raphidocelis subcapitata TaxID=307507 RepID=A0A2V0NW03_9CHLO|nr:hypothetical protein Rsub_03716 [Raphidocelis subcapitata]|eukprot:GBF90862.1 hypothetical protein Rsub_03716 [Raphidocelis subcapitata]
MAYGGAGVPLPGAVMAGAPAFDEPYLQGQLQAKLGRKEFVTPDALATHPAARVVGVLRRCWRARSMGELAAEMGNFLTEVIYDGPFVLLQRKGQMRLWMWAAGLLGDWDFEPEAVTVTPLGSRSLVSFPAHAALFPHRSLWVPATLLLPGRVEARVDVTACVIEWVMCRPHNIPLPPALPRAAAGAALAALPHALEPLWSSAPVWPWLGEHFYEDKRKGVVRPVPGTAAAADTTAMGDASYDAVIDFAAPASRGLFFRAQRAAASAAETAEAARARASAAAKDAASAAEAARARAAAAAKDITNRAAATVGGAADAAKAAARGGFESAAAAVGMA